ncbi:MAG: GTPase HflX [Acidimicrobiia bacterium]|nr:MAG: GTPase HflX [Acidimicrobiia bacterium]
MTDRPVSRDRQRLTATVTDVTVERQRAVLVSLVTEGSTMEDAEESLEEMERLVDTAGSVVVGRVVQRRLHPDPATYVGKGKVFELTALCRSSNADLVVVDGEVTPIQQRNLQQALEVDVVDRVALILDIFALHATSRAGMAQVELAMNRYRLPRLRGKGVEMSRLGGGIGTRGPGETRLEVDRRRVQTRISQLERELAGLATTRATQRKARRRAAIPGAALVGYTNAGKSSLLNALTGAEVLVEDRLFSTLDATVRRLPLASGREILLTDTVGFVRDLPHTLVEAFRSTLEEAVDTDLLLHVVDASATNPERQIASVRSTLQEIGAHTLPELLVLNKIDAAETAAVRRLRELHPDAIPVSAATRQGLDDLRERVESALAPTLVDLELVIPFDRGEIVSFLHREGEVLSEAHAGEGTRLKVRLPRRHVAAVAAFEV